MGRSRDQTSTRLAALDAVANKLVEEKVAPAASVALAVRCKEGWQMGFGASGNCGTTAATPGTIFDLASVTKPFLAVTAAILSQKRLFALSDELGQLLPEIRGTPSERATLRQLLSHRAGLVPHVALYAPLSYQHPFVRAAALRHAASARSLSSAGPPDASPPIYSDLGYILAGAALERVTGKPLDVLVKEWLSGPWGLEVGSVRQWLASDSAFGRSVAPTENVAWRGGVLRAVVHDENAWALSGHGLSGHAGLFGTSEGVLRFGMALLDVLHQRRHDLLSSVLLQKLVAPRTDSSLRMGFDSPSGDLPAAGRRASESTFGHLGFTGTSFWCDPERDTVSVLLTNRVHPTRTHLAIRSARPKVSDLLADLAQNPTLALRPA